MVTLTLVKLFPGKSNREETSNFYVFAFESLKEMIQENIR